MVYNKLNNLCIGVSYMPNSQTKKKKDAQKEKELKAFNPTKSKIGRTIILILAIGMVLGMFIAMIINGIETLT